MKIEWDLPIKTDDGSTKGSELTGVRVVSFGGRKMRYVLRNTLLSIAVLLALFTVEARPQPILWYEPSNGQEAGGNLPDFMQLFDPAEITRWPNAQRETNILLLRTNTLRNAITDTPSFITEKLAPFLSRTGLRLALDSGVATFASCQETRSNERRLERELDLMRRIENAGIRISHVALQSTLSKLRNRQTDCPGYTLAGRINDIAWYIETVRKGLGIQGGNSTQFGLIDASVAKGRAWVEKHLGVPRLEEAYDQLFKGLAAKGLRLDFALLDQPWEANRDFNSKGRSSLQEVADFQRWLESRNVAPGVFLTSTKSATEAEFRTRVIAMLEGLKRHGAPFRHFVLASWKTIPHSELPENPAEQGRYPMTKILNEVGLFIDGPGKK